MDEGQMPGYSPSADEMVLTTRVLGGLLVSHRCGFQSYWPNGIRPAGWTRREADEFVSRMAAATRIEL